MRETHHLPASVLAMFRDHDGYLRWSADVEGNLVRHNCMILGMRAGPERSLGNEVITEWERKCQLLRTVLGHQGEHHDY